MDDAISFSKIRVSQTKERNVTPTKKPDHAGEHPAFPPKVIYCKRSNLCGVGIAPTVLMKTQETPKDGYEKYIHESHSEELLRLARAEALGEAVDLIKSEQEKGVLLCSTLDALDEMSDAAREGK